MDDPEIKAKFPDLQQGKSPSLGNVYGIGTMLLGKRDHDAETGTYVATHYFTLFYIPLLSLGAYRVADAQGGGWFCVGKVPLSGRSKGLNVLLALAVLGIAGGIWWRLHTRSPEYAARQKLKQADEAAAAGKGGEAARLCREVMDSKTPHVEEGKKKLAGFIENPPGPPSEAAEVYTIAVDLHRENRCPVGNLFQTGKSVADRCADADPAAALALLEVIAPLADDVDSELNARRDLLEKLIARSPNDPEIASRLAAVYEAKGDRARCEQLLTPLEEKLGSLDGAAILGRIYASKGDFERAYKLLRPFVDARLPAFRAAEQGFAAQIKESENRIFEELKAEKTKEFNYDQYQRLGKQQQIAMVEEFIANHMKRDPKLNEARKRLMAERGAIPAALDLGLVQLQRAETMANPVRRKAELEDAERTLLSIRGFAGESDEYRLSLGRVYYWLGRQAEGKKQFEELLASRDNSSEIVVQVVNTLRNLGETTEARRMAEEAYKKETDQRKKYMIASFRALLQIDTDDEIQWLSRANPDEPSVQSGLSSARGRKAREDGKDEEAIKHYRHAIEIYDKQPETSSTLNNSSLNHFALYRITQDRAEFTRGADKLDRAIALQPSDSILLSNAAGTVTEGAFVDVIGAAIDFRKLKHSAGWDSLAYLYRGQAERTAVVDRAAKHPGLVKARGYAEKLMILAPKRSDAYATLDAIFGLTRDHDGLKTILAKLEKADLDLADAAREYKDFLSGKSDPKRGEDSRKALTRATEGLAAARGAKDRTFALAVGRYVGAKQSVWLYGDKIDADELVKLADEAHSAVPSDGTESVLNSALLLRAHLTLIRDEPEYAKLAERTRRGLGSSLLYYVLANDSPLRSKVLANPDMKRIAALAMEEFKLDPDGVGPAAALIVRVFHPAESAAIVKTVNENERQRVQRKIDRLLSPYAAGVAFSDYLALHVAGKDAEAKKLMEEMKVKGIPVP